MIVVGLAVLLVVSAVSLITIISTTIVSVLVVSVAIVVFVPSVFAMGSGVTSGLPGAASFLFVFLFVFMFLTFFRSRPRRVGSRSRTVGTLCEIQSYFLFLIFFLSFIVDLCILKGFVIADQLLFLHLHL